MLSVKESNFYNELVKEFNYSFGNVFIFNGFIISEINEGETIDWKNAKLIIDDVTSFLDSKGEDIVYISNRINSYSVVPTDWLKFFKQSYSLKAYCIVSENKVGTLNSAI